MVDKEIEELRRKVKLNLQDWSLSGRYGGDFVESDYAEQIADCIVKEVLKNIIKNSDYYSNMLIGGDNGAIDIYEEWKIEGDRD